MGSFKQDVDIPALLARLDLKEKISLLSAVDWWRTPVIDRPGVFVPHMKVGRATNNEVLGIT
jgi:beta-glucosidase